MAAQAENLFVLFEGTLLTDVLMKLQAASAAPQFVRSAADLAEAALRDLKYSTCLPPAVQEAIYAARYLSVATARQVLAREVVGVCTGT